MIIKTYEIKPGANLAGADLSEANLEGIIIDDSEGREYIIG